VQEVLIEVWQLLHPGKITLQALQTGGLSFDGKFVPVQIQVPAWLLNVL